MGKRIAFVSLWNPFEDRKAWSGTIFKFREGLEKAGFEVVWIKYRRPRWCYYLLGVLSKLVPGNSHPFHNRIYFKACANTINQQLIEDCDYLFFPGGAQMMPYLNVVKPVIYYSDATFHLMSDYYWNPTNRLLDKEGNRCEQAAMDATYLKISASDWAASDAETYYNFPKNRSAVIELGPNLDSTDICPSAPYCSGKLYILFSGVDWNRKGGDKAIAVVRHLIESGIDCRLMICGVRDLPKWVADLPFVENYGFLDKNNEKEYAQYISLWSKAHIFLLPTVAECAGIVFSESSAFGVPIFTHDTGGIGNYVENGVNGYRMPVHSSPMEFSELIIKCISNGELCSLGAGGLRLYKERLNWEHWADRMRSVINGIGV